MAPKGLWFGPRTAINWVASITGCVARKAADTTILLLEGKEGEILLLEGKEGEILLLEGKEGEILLLEGKEGEILLLEGKEGEANTFAAFLHGRKLHSKLLFSFGITKCY